MCSPDFLNTCQQTIKRSRKCINHSMDSNKFSKIQKFFCFSFVFVRDFLCFVCLFGFLFCFVLFLLFCWFFVFCLFVLFCFCYVMFFVVLWAFSLFLCFVLFLFLFREGYFASF